MLFLKFSLNSKTCIWTGAFFFLLTRSKESSRITYCMRLGLGDFYAENY